tara:strand:+ start:919 stop:1428 length:510 start_codon:yes stop_codon:yes gene_type:complete
MTTHAQDDDTLTYRSASPEDGAALWRLVRDAGTLELNSAYFYLVFATDFGETCLIAERDGTTVGAVVGYRPPRDPDAAFVWQVGVAPQMRGKGMGKKLLREWLKLPGVRNAKWMTATITADNVPSQKLFKAVARDLGVDCTDQAHFTENLFPEPHEAERLYRIGPFEKP